LVRLREKLALDFHDGWPQAAAELEVALVDGRVLKATHDAGIPSADIAAQGERLAAKFDALAEPRSAPHAAANCARRSSVSTVSPTLARSRGLRPTD